MTAAPDGPRPAPPAPEATFGRAGRIGVIAPSTCERVAKEFYQVAPDDLGLLVATLPISQIRQDHVDAALAGVEAAAAQLAATGAEAVYAAGLPLVVVGGEAFDAELRRRVEEVSGLPGSGTDLSVALAGLRELDLRDILLVTPFTQEYTGRIAALLADCGINVLGYAGMGHERQIEYGLLPDSAPRDAVRELLARHPEARGVYVPCGRIGNVRHVSAWEREFGVPVLTANQLFIWWALRHAGAAPVPDDCGELLTRMRRSPAAMSTSR